MSLSESDVEINDLKKHYVFEGLSVNTPNKRTAILAKDSQYYSPQNEDAGSDICVEETQIIEICNKEADEPRNFILRELEELKKLNF